MMRKSIIVVIGFAVSGFIASYASAARWGGVAVSVLVGLLWLIEPWHHGSWTSTVGLLACAALAAMGVVLGLPTFWLLSSLVAALVAWDLDHLDRYLGDVPDIRNETVLINSHLRRLGVVAGLGWSLGVVALRVQLAFDFIWTLALSFLVVMGLSGAIGYMRRENDQV